MAQSKPDKATRLGEPAPEPSGPGLVTLQSAIFKDVQVKLVARLGAMTLTVEEILAMRSGTILALDRQISEPIDLYLNDTLVARGEIVAVDDNFAVRIVEVADQ